MAEMSGASKSSPPRLSPPVPLTAEDDLSDFDCGEPTLNDCLLRRALKIESRFSRTYSVCDGCRVVAYCCISAGAVARAAASRKIRRNEPDSIPVSLVGRWAVSRDHAVKGLGADILSDALRRIAVASQSMGIGAVLVHGKNDAAKRFQIRCAEFLGIRK